MTRRFFLASSAAWSAGCAMHRPPEAGTTASVRPPAVGQTWRYSQRDLFTDALIDNQLDRVAVVDRSIEIASNSEAIKDEARSPARWGTDFLRKYIARREKAAGPLPSEIQDPWGMVKVDPHWGQVQVFQTPVPLWPTQLRPGWQTHVVTRYKTPANQDPLLWDQVMKAHAWETVGVPAGQFTALRFTNSIHFGNGDITRVDSVRQETLWFAPEVGRWVARESRGSYYVDDSVVDQPYNENGFRWELLEWS